jgi:hypothetical protein
VHPRGGEGHTSRRRLGERPSPRRGERAVDYPAKIGRHFGATGAHRRFNKAAESEELRRRSSRNKPPGANWVPTGVSVRLMFPPAP